MSYKQIIGSGECSYGKLYSVILGSKQKQDLVDNWFDIGKYIGVPPEKIDDLKYRYQSKFTKPVFKDILSDWQARKGNGAKLEKFLVILDHHKLNQISDDLRKHFSTNNEDQQSNSTALDAAGSSVSLLNEPKQNFRQCGKISYNLSDVLGKGCNDTKVYKGTFENRPVAVKRINCEFTDEKRARDEIDALLKCDGGENVIRYHAAEFVSGDGYILIALELCMCTLHKWVETNGECISPNEISEFEILYQTTNGLTHLHDQRIVHRDLKPENILLKLLSPGNVVVKISDFGLIRNLPDERSSMTLHTGSGSEGWTAPEILKFHEQEGKGAAKITKATDIFALGCIFFYALTRGSHPFGDKMRRQINVLDYKPQLDKTSLQNFQNGDISLIRSMIAEDPKDRPPAKAITLHNVFWDMEKKLQFLVNVSNLVENPSTERIKCKSNAEKIYKEKTANKSSWISQLSPAVKTYINEDSRRQYNGNSVMELVRAIRNLANHYENLPNSVKKALGDYPGEFMLYWDKRFPSVVPIIWKEFQALKKTPSLRKYYDADYDFSYS